MMGVQLPPGYFRRYDESDDSLFYQMPRKVVHIDDGAIAAAGALYTELLPPDGHILDLMSSWRTHLPSDYRAASVVGLGMNAEEMRDNPQLSRYDVQNLNQNAILPYAENQFDGSICTVSVQYLTNPVAVMEDLRRVLRPGAPAIFTYSNRCFPTKAVAIWQESSMSQKAELLAFYLQQAGYVDIRMEDRSPKPNSLARMFGGGGDPLFGVWGRKGNLTSLA